MSKLWLRNLRMRRRTVLTENGLERLQRRRRLSSMFAPVRRRAPHGVYSLARSARSAFGGLATDYAFSCPYRRLHEVCFGDVSGFFLGASTSSEILAALASCGLATLGAKACCAWSRTPGAEDLRLTEHNWPTDCPLPASSAGKALGVRFTRYGPDVILSARLGECEGSADLHFALLVVSGRSTSLLARGLRTVATSAGQALSSIMELARARHHTDSLEALDRIGRTLAAQLDLDKLFTSMYGEVSSIFSGDVFYVSLYDERTSCVEMAYVYEAGELLAPFTAPIGDNLVASVIRTGEPFLHNSGTQTLPGASSRFGNPRKSAQSVMMVPLFARNRILGVLSVQSYELGKFNKDDLQILATIGDHAALAIENARLYRELYRQASTDFLTGLLNRDHFMTEVDARLRTRDAVASESALVMFDSDGLKNINDTLGHLAGDAFICHLAATIRRHAGPNASVCRHGGDEFLAFFDHCDRRAAVKFARQVIESLKGEACLFDDKEIRGTASAGVAVFPHNATTGEGLLQAADSAMYHAKMVGKACVAVRGKDEALEVVQT